MDGWKYNAGKPGREFRCILLAVVLLSTEAALAGAVDYASQIRPILKERWNMTNRTDHFLTSMVRRRVRSETAALEMEIVELGDTLNRVLMELSELKNLILDNLEMHKETGNDE